jgi:hypothetical protein
VRDDTPSKLRQHANADADTHAGNKRVAKVGHGIFFAAVLGSVK